MTDKPQVLYRMYDKSDGLLYIGITMSPPARFADHRRDKPWWPLIARIALEHFDTREELAAAELAAIKAELPLYNRLGLPRPPSVCEPSPELAAGIREYEEAKRLMEDARKELRAIIARDLRTLDITCEQMAKHTPWTAETIRGIAREYGVPRRREPTVRSIVESVN